MKKALFLASLAAFLSAGEIEISDPTIKITPPNMDKSAIFMTIKNASNADVSLIGATSNLTEAVELHDHVKDGEMMKMMKVEKIEISANSSVELKPGGLHIMLFELQNAVSSDTNASVTLKFSDGSEVLVEKIEPKDYQPMHHAH